MRLARHTLTLHALHMRVSALRPAASSRFVLQPSRAVSMVQTVARAAVNHALDRAVISSSSSSDTASLDVDVATWRAIVDQPIVESADNIDATQLYLVSNDMIDCLDLTAHPGASSVDPFAQVADDVKGMNASIREILGVDHPVLAKVSQYFFDSSPGKKVRPAMVLLMSHAVNGHMAATAASAATDTAASDSPRANKINTIDCGAAAAVRSSSASNSISNNSAAASSLYADDDGLDGYASNGTRRPRPAFARADAVWPLQRRLAEITEMIHTASLLHDDVIDMADTRRGIKSVNNMFGNKLAVLAGDFLLARASVCLARLRSVPVVEVLSTVIEHLVKGEVMQMRTAIATAIASTASSSSPAASVFAAATAAALPPRSLRHPSHGHAAAAALAAHAEAAALTGVCRVAFDVYLRKTFYKTGSLMANSCRAVALLGRYPDSVSGAAFRYGMHVGMAFQLVDDLLDFEGQAALLGKPVMNDVKQGLATAPVLFAAQQFPVLLPCIQRKFEAPGDVDLVLKFVAAADSLTATRRLAIAHGQMALDALAELEPSAARTALAALVTTVLSRDS